MTVEAWVDFIDGDWIDDVPVNCFSKLVYN